jgi:hypothetical protein
MGKQCNCSEHMRMTLGAKAGSAYSLCNCFGGSSHRRENTPYQDTAYHPRRRASRANLPGYSTLKTTACVFDFEARGMPPRVDRRTAKVVGTETREKS